MRPQSQPPPAGERKSDQQDDQSEDKKQKENMAYAKKVVLRLAGLMGLGGAVGVVYIFGELILWDGPFYFCRGRILSQEAESGNTPVSDLFLSDYLDYLTCGISSTVDQFPSKETRNEDKAQKVFFLSLFDFLQCTVLRTSYMLFSTDFVIGIYLTDFSTDILLLCINIFYR